MREITIIITALVALLDDVARRCPFLAVAHRTIARGQRAMTAGADQ
jgi:hypothetical protein